MLEESRQFLGTRGFLRVKPSLHAPELLDGNMLRKRAIKPDRYFRMNGLFFFFSHPAFTPRKGRVRLDRAGREREKNVHNPDRQLFEEPDNLLSEKISRYISSLKELVQHCRPKHCVRSVEYQVKLHYRSNVLSQILPSLAHFIWYAHMRIHPLFSYNSGIRGAGYLKGDF